MQSRAVLDVQAIPALNEYAPSVPVFADPSHSTFKRSYVTPMSLAAIAAGANGALTQPYVSWLITAAAAATGNVNIVEAG